MGTDGTNSWTPPEVQRTAPPPPPYGTPTGAVHGPPPAPGHPPAPAYHPASAAPAAPWPPLAHVRVHAVQGLAVAAAVLAVVTVLVDWVRAAAAPAAADALRRAADAGEVPPLTLYDGAATLGIVVLPTWIVTSLWLQKVRANAAAIAPHEVRRSEVWSFLGWVVPVVSLWFPKQIVDDSSRVAASALSVRGTVARPVPTLAWWLTWLAYSALGNAAGGLPSSGATTVRPWVDLLAAATGTVALVLWLRVLRDVTRTNDALLQAPAAA